MFLSHRLVALEEVVDDKLLSCSSNDFPVLSFFICKGFVWSSILPMQHLCILFAVLYKSLYVVFKRVCVCISRRIKWKQQ